MRLRVPGDAYSDPVALAQLPKEADKAALGGVERGRHSVERLARGETKLSHNLLSELLTEFK